MVRRESTNKMHDQTCVGLLLAGSLVMTGCSKRDIGEDDSADSDFPSDTISGSGGSGGDGDGEKFDLGGGMESAGPGEAGISGCEKVDFLFVVDSSRSMEDEQANLLDSFPRFITAIRETLMLDDFQVMAVDAGAVEGSGCDGTLGAGRIADGAGQDCGLSGDKRYADNTQSDLEAAFGCMAARGIEGATDEQTMDALVAAVGPLNEAGGCNEGFVRPDALLVVVIITDEEDSPNDIDGAGALDGTCAPADTDPNSSGGPSEWADALAAAKADNPNAVVVLSLIGDCDVGGDCTGMALGPQGITGPVSGAEPAPRIREFTQQFAFGTVGPICAEDYVPFFTDAVDVVRTACEGFLPPG